MELQSKLKPTDQPAFPIDEGKQKVKLLNKQK